MSSDDGVGGHRLRRLVARDPHEEGRASSPLELLFDLTYVVAVGVAAAQGADMVAAGHPGRAVLGFVFAMFAILVCWINYSWFASAFDSDDWAFRICTMLQMIGVVVLALGLPSVFHSIELGHHVDVRLMVAGYVVMRVGLVALWLRVARADGRYRAVAVRNAVAIVLIQVCWVVFALVDLELLPTFVLIVVLGSVELLLPVVAQGRANGTPWHPHHIADRYAAFAIIALGEGVVGTIASSRAALGGATGLAWDTEIVMVVVAGIGLTFAMWWIYFVTPFGDLLRLRPARGYLFGYGHIAVLIAIAATGAGLHGAGLFLADGSTQGATAVVCFLAVPVGVYLLGVYGLHTLLLSSADPFHLLLLALTLALLVAAVVGSALGLPMPAALLVVTAAAYVPVVGYEALGHRHQAAMLAELRSRSA